MTPEEQFEALKAEKKRALATIDMDFARRIMPDASSDYVRLLAMHKARYEATDISRELRHESGQWLRSRGKCRVGGLPLLPQGELPK